MKKLQILGFSLLLSFFSLSQTSESKFYLAEEHLEYGRFSKAIELYSELYNEDQENSHFAYKLGLSYLQGQNNRLKAIPFLEQALKNISGDYDSEFDTKTAPSEVLFYLATAYHLNYQLDEALALLNRFKMILDSKTEFDLIKQVDKKIIEIKYGQDFVQNPINIEIDNLGPKINTEFPEYSPAISADENTLVFTSRRPDSKGGLKTKNDQFFEDIYISKKENGNWTNPKKIEAINSDEHEASISLSADGSQLFVYRDDVPKKASLENSRDGNIYISTNINGDWTALKKLPNNINTESWETHASITPDGNTLYFVSNKPGGYGGRDIYITHKLENGEWGEPQNLGKEINTQYEEDGPFIHPDGKTLYFSSQSHSSMGGFDIFSSELDEATGKWSTPKNIGYPINSTDDDVFFTLSPDGKRGYFASSNQEVGFGEKDIYITYLKGIREKCLVVLKGKITTINNTIPASTLITINKENGDLQGLYKPNSTSGEYILILPSSAKYNVTYSANNFKTEATQIITPDTTCYFEIKKEIILPYTVELPVAGGSIEIDNPFEEEVNNKEELALKKEETKELEKIIENNASVQNIIVLKNIFFDFDKSNLRPESKKELDKLFDFLSENKDLRVEIAGHTDAMGSFTYNSILSYKRAKSVLNFQVNKGINKNRIYAKGYGETQPIARNSNPDGTDNPKGRQINRRIELRILKPDNSQLNVVKNIKVGAEIELTNTDTDFSEKKEREINKNYSVTYKGDSTQIIELSSSNLAAKNVIPFPVPTSETSRLSDYFTVQLCAISNIKNLNYSISKFEEIGDLWIYKIGDFTKISSGRFQNKENAIKLKENLAQRGINSFIANLPIHAQIVTK